MAEPSYAKQSPIGLAMRSWCPRCGRGRLFNGFLKLAQRCDVCGLDYGFADPADGSAFFVMMTAAVPATAFGIWLELTSSPLLWVHAVTTLPIVLFSFSAHSLSPLLPAFMADNPEVTVCLALSDRVVDLIDEGYDCVFRAGQLHDSARIARGLRPLQLIACAAPAYLARHGRPERPGDLVHHACLGFAGSTLEERWTFCGDGGETVVPVVSRFSVNSGEALRQATLAGLGIVLHVEELLAEDVLTGRLVHILPEWRSERPPHILYAPDRRIKPKLHSFLDFTVARFGAKQRS